MRLAKFLAQQGITSRRKAEELIATGQVTVNGEVIRQQGTQVDPQKDRVTVSGKSVSAQKDRPQLILFHKPRNVLVTKHDPQDRPTIFDYLKDLPNNFNPVGRLDFDSEGLVLLTNDGELLHQLAHPSFEVTKVYEVKVGFAGAKTLAEAVQQLRQGVSLEDGPAQPDHITLLKENPHNQWIQINLHQGRNRIIRRMCEAVGLKVLRLKRVAIGPYQMGDLPPGRWRQETQKTLQTGDQTPQKPSGRKSNKPLYSK